jgi:hypothetical protein
LAPNAIISLNPTTFMMLTDTSPEVRIFSINSTTINQIGSYDRDPATDTPTRYGAFAFWNGYVVQDATLFSFDLGQYSWPRNTIDSTYVGYNVRDMIGTDDGIFVAHDNSLVTLFNAQNQQIYQLDIGSEIVQNISFDAASKHLFIATNSGFTTYDFRSPSAPQFVSSAPLPWLSSPKLHYVGNDALIVSWVGTPNYLVYDVSDRTQPSLCGSQTLPGTIRSMSRGLSGATPVFVVLTDAQDAEISLIQGGTLRADQTVGYVPSGIYTSEVFDIGTSATSRALTRHVDIPSGTSLQWQVRSSNTLPSITNASWVGTDGNNGTYINASGDLPAHVMTDKRYIQYRALFSGTTSASPRIFSTRITYDQ